MKASFSLWEWSHCSHFSSYSKKKKLPQRKTTARCLPKDVTSFFYFDDAGGECCLQCWSKISRTVGVQLSWDLPSTKATAYHHQACGFVMLLHSFNQVFSFNLSPFCIFNGGWGARGTDAGNVILEMSFSNVGNTTNKIPLTLGLRQESQRHIIPTLGT